MFVVLKRKEIVKALIAFVVFVSSVVCLNFADVDRTVFAKSNKKLPVYSVDNADEKTIAISFDAAWGADKTKKIVDLLKELAEENGEGFNGGKKKKIKAPEKKPIIRR